MSTTDSTAEQPTQYNREQWRDKICETIREAQADGCVDLGGGVSVSELTARIDGRDRSAVSKRVTSLTEKGVLERQSGIGYDTHRPRDSYVIADGGEDVEVSI